MSALPFFCVGTRTSLSLLCTDCVVDSTEQDRLVFQRLFESFASRVRSNARGRNVSPWTANVVSKDYFHRHFPGCPRCRIAGAGASQAVKGSDFGLIFLALILSEPSPATKKID